MYSLKYHVKFLILMSSATSQSHKHENTRLDNSTYNVLSAAGKEADFLYSTVDQYIEDAKNDGRQHLVDLWNEKEISKSI